MNRRSLAPSLFALFVLHACASAPEPAAAPAATPMSATPTPERSEMPMAPWAIIFADASGNSFHFQQASPEARANFEYTPITWEESSSGSYSGGMAASGELTPLQVQQIWAEVEALRDDTTSHVAQRMMGTGSFGVVERGVRHDFIVRAGPAVKAFTALVAPLHDP